MRGRSSWTALSQRGFSLILLSPDPEHQAPCRRQEIRNGSTVLEDHPLQVDADVEEGRVLRNGTGDERPSTRIGDTGKEEEDAWVHGKIAGGAEGEIVGTRCEQQDRDRVGPGVGEADPEIQVSEPGEALGGSRTRGEDARGVTVGCPAGASVILRPS